MIGIVFKERLSRSHLISDVVAKASHWLRGSSRTNSLVHGLGLGLVGSDLGGSGLDLGLEGCYVVSSTIAIGDTARELWKQKLKYNTVFDPIKYIQLLMVGSDVGMIGSVDDSGLDPDHDYWLLTKSSAHALLKYSPAIDARRATKIIK